jgi:hypothetical protein
MKLTKIAVAIALASASVSISYAQTTPASFEVGKEYWGVVATYDDNLKTVKATDAWARGWTGNGQLILIIDSGIKTDHTDFDGKIKYFIDYTKTGINDNLGHGTAVAGAAAAAYNGFGAIGVAPGANLAIAKVTNTSGYNFTSAYTSLSWGANLGAVVANMSANLGYDTSFKKNMQVINVSNGTYYNQELTTRFKSGYYMNMTPDALLKAAGPTMVVVVAAGNSGLPYPEMPANLATAVDKNGALVMGGRMLIVGGYNISTNDIWSGSNKAGTICATIVNGVCGDKYRTSDFYIMAPSVYVWTTSNTTTTSANQATGTSFAAPQVAGAVAVVKQMWPQLKGGEIVQILLRTANKNIPGYRDYIHGQGLLDMEKATRPLGQMQVKLASGEISNMSGGLILGNMTTFKPVPGSSIMGFDSFNRDFYLDSNIAVHYANDTNDLTLNQSSKMDWMLSRFVRNDSLTTGAFILSNDGEYGSNFIGYQTSYKDSELKFSVLTQVDKWADVQISGMHGDIKRSAGYSVGVGHNFAVNDKSTLNINADFGELRASINPGLVTSFSPLRMASLTASYKYNFTPTSYVGLRVNTVHTFDGALNMTTPSGVNYDEASDALSVQYANNKMPVQDGLPKYAAWAEFSGSDPEKSLGYTVYAGWQQQSNVSSPVVGLNLLYKYN